MILAAYAALAVVVQVHCADLLTSDGECYLRMAASYAKGDFRHAVFGHWSPLGAWMAAPLVLAGMAPRFAFRLMIGLWGALCVAGTWRLARRVSGVRCWGLGVEEANTEHRTPNTSTGAWLRAAATACAALLAVEFSFDHRVDLLLAAALLFYLDAVMDERLLRSRPWALWTGALGGIAYLAKLYALPFFAAHFTLTVLARAWVERGSRQQADNELGFQVTDLGPYPNTGHRTPDTALGRVALAWGLGVAGFALIAAPWVAVLSAKYGRLTFGTAAATSYALVGPGSGDARREAITGLHRPPDDAPNVWQDATREPPMPRTVSPQVSLAKKLRTAGSNTVVILGHIARLDEFRLGLIALALLPLAVVATRRDRASAFRYAALLLAVVVFCGGYAFIQAENPRYFWFAFLVLAVMAFHFAGLVPAAVARLGAGRREQMLVGVAVAALAIVSFGFHPVRAVGDLLRRDPPGEEYRLAARWLASMGVTGPLASAGERGWWDGLHTAYYLGAKYAGSPRATTPREIAAEMRQAGATTLLVWDGGLRMDPALAEAEFEEIGMGLFVERGRSLVVFRLR